MAREAGLKLRETTLVIFGNPATGTPVMDAALLAALDFAVQGTGMGGRQPDPRHLLNLADEPYV